MQGVKISAHTKGFDPRKSKSNHLVVYPFSDIIALQYVAEGDT